MENKPKYIYETTVNKQVIEKVTEEREENGEKLQITKDVKKIKPIKIAISKPDRKKYKEADIFYAKTLSNYLKEGLLPHSLVSKRYMNDGGPLTENEKKAINAMREQYSTLQEEYFKMEIPLSDENIKRRGEIILEMSEINRVIKEIQNSYADIFENTAEAKTKNDTIEWWILNLSMIDENDKDYDFLYGVGDYESKTQTLEKLESKDDDFTNEVIKKLSYFISFWYSSGADLINEDFKAAEKHYNENLTKYLVPEEKKENKEEPEEVKDFAPPVKSNSMEASLTAAPAPTQQADASVAQVVPATS